jgi:hypothetical protein
MNRQELDTTIGNAIKDAIRSKVSAIDILTVLELNKMTIQTLMFKEVGKQF